MEIDKKSVVPPHDLEAEEALIGAILVDSSSMDKISDIVKADDFYSSINKIIFQAISELYGEGYPVDLLTVKNKLEKTGNLERIGGAAGISRFVTSIPSIASAVTYAKIVREKSIARKLIETSKEIVDHALSGEKDITELLDLAESKVFSISERGISHNFVSISESLEEAFERIDRIHKEKGSLRGISTGFYDLDNYLSGFQKGDLIVLAARPGMGKSSFALDIARNVATKQKEPVAVFSLEMSKDQVVDRFIASQANIDLWRMRTGKMRDEDFEKIQIAYGELYEAPIYIDDSLTTNVLDIRSKSRKLRAESGLSMIVVDYLQLLEGKNKESRVQEVSEISRHLKSLARELNIPILACAQLSRAVEQRPDKRPILSDLRESGSIEQDADVVLFIFRESYYKPENQENKEKTPNINIAEIIIAKHRNGPTGVVKLFWDREKVSFRNLEKTFEEKDFE